MAVLSQKVDKTTFVACIISEVLGDCKERMEKFRKHLQLPSGCAERIPAEKPGKAGRQMQPEVLFCDYRGKDAGIALLFLQNAGTPMDGCKCNGNKGAFGGAPVNKSPGAETIVRNGRAVKERKNAAVSGRFPGEIRLKIANCMKCLKRANNKRGQRAE